MAKYKWLGTLLLIVWMLTGCGGKNESLMPYIEENDALLQKALGDYEVLNEEIDGYWAEAGGLPYRSYYSIFKIKYTDFTGNDVIMTHQVFEDTDYEFSSQTKLVENLKAYCKNELGRNCSIYVVDANDYLNHSMDAEDDFDLRADLAELFKDHPTSYIRVSEEDDEVIKWVLDTFPKANIYNQYTIVEPEDNNGVLSGGVYGVMDYINGQLVYEDAEGTRDEGENYYAQLLLDTNGKVVNSNK